MKNESNKATIHRVELHTHTKMSAMEGIISPAELVAHAAKLGHKAVAITDHDSVQAFPEAYKAGKEHGIKVIYGAEVGLLTNDNDSPDYYHAVLLAKNMTGLRNLYKLISLSHTKYYNSKYNDPQIPKEVLSEHREGLLVGSACEIGELYEALLDNQHTHSDVPVFSQEHLIEIAENYDLLEICTARLVELYGTNSPNEVQERYVKERSSIIENGFAGVYMIARRLSIKATKDGKLIGCRGSVGSSFVAYILGITEVNPIEHNIPFEVFSGLSGEKVPNIDFNVEASYQPNLVSYLQNMFGDDKVVRAGL